MNGILRFLALPICGGSSVVVVFGCMVSPEKYLEAGFVIAFFLLGFALTMIVGWPLLALLEWKFSRYRLRYIFGGLVCSLLAWLLMEGAFFPGAWEQIWAKKSFWKEWVPRRIFLYSAIGLSAGSFYTFIVAIINKKFPPKARNE